jgi:hypothetical protein
VLGLKQRLRDERGTVLTIFAVGIPTIILFLALALDIGNWYVHKRQLQNRVDDAVYAAAVEYGFRFPGCIANSSQADMITQKAKQFAGDTSVTGAVNTDINSNATVTVNSLNISPGSDGTDGGNPCFDHAPNAADPSSPLGGYWTDVKAQESNLASLFGGFGVPVPAITSRARIGLLQPETISGLRPFAVADTNLIGRNASGAAVGTCGAGAVAGAWIRLRDHNGSVLGSPLELSRQGSSTTWTLSANLGAAGVGSSVNFTRVDVVLGSCSNSSQRIVYQNIGFIDDRPDNENNTQVGRVELDPNACNAWGQYIYRETTSCNISISAFVDFVPDCAPFPGTPNPRERVFATLAGEGEIELDGGPGNSPGPTWTGSWGAVNAGSGPTGGPAPGSKSVTLRRQCPTQGGNQSIGLGQHQAVMAGNDSQEGPIRNLTLGTTSVDNPAAVTETFSLELEPLHSDGLGDLRVPIRGAAPSSGNFMSGAVTCGTNGPSAVGGATGSVAAGCTGPFAPSSACVTGAACSLTVMASGGSGSGALQGAYNNAWCSSPNNWALYPNIPRGDPRLITVAVTTPGAPFSESGTGNSQSITRFAGFYVTGWAGVSCGSSSPGNEASPPAIDTANAGAIWGHFVKFVATPSSGTPTEQPCRWGDPTGGNDVALCIAALVR